MHMNTNLGSIRSWMIFLIIFQSYIIHILAYMPQTFHRHIPFNNDIFSLNVVTFNTWGLPVKLPGMDQSKRFESIPDSLLLLGADVICLQETFSKRLRSKIMDKMPLHFKHNSDYSCHRRQAGMLQIDCFGGLMTWSKHPVIYEEFFPFPLFDKMNWVEQSGRKGVLITTIEVNGIPVNIVNTHLYAGFSSIAESFRLKQIHFIDSILKDNNYYHEYPSVFAGDFNTPHPEISTYCDKQEDSEIYPFIIQNMKFIDTCPKMDDDAYTYDPLCNPYAKQKEPRSRIDYIFTKSGKVSHIHLQKQKGIFKEFNLSDHFGWMVELSIRTKQNVKEDKDMNIVALHD